MVKAVEKIKVAEELLPLYKAWHIACLKQYDSKATKAAELAMWDATSRYPGYGLPTKIEASVGRWCERVLKISLSKEDWYYNKMNG